MKFELVKEHEDGSATVLIDFEPNEISYLLNYAVVETLKKAIAEGKILTPEDNDE